MIRKAQKKDVAAIAELAIRMWEDNTVEALTAEFSEVLEMDEAAVFLMETDGAPVGFAQCQLRHDYVEGTSSSPVGYLEGIYVKDDLRGRGYAGEMLAACEAWAREKGCTEFASDCELSNTVSYDFHMHVGFKEANRVICFTKKI